MAAGGDDDVRSSSEDATADRKLTESRDQEAVHDGSDVIAPSVNARTVVDSNSANSTATDADQTNTGRET